MPNTFPRVTSPNVDTSFNQTDTGLYPDAQLFTGGSFAAAVIPIIGQTASLGQLWRGMPAAVDPTTGRITSPAASGAVCRGVLLDDMTTYILAKGTKVTFIKKGRVRSYAAGTLAFGDPVKMDTASNFGGFKKFIAGTDDPTLNVGRAFPLDDGSTSNGQSNAVAMAQGDTIFIDLDA